MLQCSSSFCRRLADQLLQAFHDACDEGDTEAALSLLTWLVEHVEQPSDLPAGLERRAAIRLIGAHERLYNLMLMRQDGMSSDQQADWLSI